MQFFSRPHVQRQDLLFGPPVPVIIANWIEHESNFP